MNCRRLFPLNRLTCKIFLLYRWSRRHPPGACDTTCSGNVTCNGHGNCNTEVTSPSLLLLPFDLQNSLQETNFKLSTTSKSHRPVFLLYLFSGCLQCFSNNPPKLKMLLQCAVGWPEGLSWLSSCASCFEIKIFVICCGVFEKKTCSN